VGSFIGRFCTEILLVRIAGGVAHNSSSKARAFFLDRALRALTTGGSLMVNTN
jgi:hypothetical protein